MRAPATFGRYVEPFLGGGAMFFALTPDLAPQDDAALGDLNPHLIGMYRAIATDVERVIVELYGFEIEHNRAGKDRDRYYAEVRAWWNDHRDVRDGDPLCAKIAAGFLYLNRACFNALWRVNRRGEFNVPSGKKAHLVIPSSQQLRLAAAALGKAIPRCQRYDQTTMPVRSGDFVYFDPPYDVSGAAGTLPAFTSYTLDRFGVAQQRELAEHAQRLRRRGAFVMISNRRTALIEELYKGWTIARVPGARSMSASASARRAIPEVIITSDRIAPADSLAQRGRILGRAARRTVAA
jgi:DNA adenine methylase